MTRPALRDVIASSASPAAVAVALARLEESRPDDAARLAEDVDLAGAFAAVVAASRPLTSLLLTDPEALDVLAGRPIALDAGDAAELVRWKQRCVLSIAARDLCGTLDLEAVGAALADLADGVLRRSVELTSARDLAVIAMGKLGGRELNYASDVDVVFVGGAEQQARSVLEVARRCFRVDANLRPEGRDGPLVRSLASYEAYWDEWAATWEFQALLKARPAAGDLELARAFAAAATERVWTRPFGAEELRELRTMKARAEAEVARKGVAARDLKLAPGGIRDIEFSVQLLQLVHGRDDPALRAPTTLTALHEMGRSGYIAEEDAARLDAAYRFLRAVEHRLQLVDEEQVHSLPVGTIERERLARVCGHRDSAEATALAAFDAELARHRAAVRSIHERLYFRPLLEAFTGRDARLAPASLEARLAAFGFTDVQRTRQALRELTRGFTRSSRLMERMLPLLLEWLSRGPDPDLGLLGLRTLAARRHQSSLLSATFRESPEAARRLCLLVATSRLLIDAFVRHPDLLPELGRLETASPSSRPQLEAALATAPLSTVRTRKDREAAAIASREVLGLAEVEDTAAALTAAAEVVLDRVLQLVAPDAGFAIVALGRFGGGELALASDLDVVLVHDGDSDAEAVEAERAAAAVLRAVNGATPSERIFALDVGLRPEGKQGLLARSVQGFAQYYERWAEIWERQALVRARFVAGDAGVATRFLEVADEFVWNRPFSEEDTRAVRRMKARIERERVPPGEDPEFHLKLGRGSLSDVEWTAQLLQLRHGVRSPGTMRALELLARDGHLAVDDADALRVAYRFCERVRNRLYLVSGGPGDALPRQGAVLTRLARSFETTPSDLRDEYRKVTRRARAVVERVFYER